MENQQREMNFFDLCVIIGRAIGRGCMKVLRLLGKMVRLTFRFWWIVLPIFGLSIGLGIYNTRSSKINYKVGAYVFLNGPSINQFEQAFAPLRSRQLLDENDAITPYVKDKIVTDFATFRVIDAKADGVQDFVDFGGSILPTDTFCVQMNDRLYVQFLVRADEVESVPQIETAFLQFLNCNAALQASYQAFLPNNAEEMAFNHTLPARMAEMTEGYTQYVRDFLKRDKSSFVLASDVRPRLFDKEIDRMQKKIQLGDYRTSLATAPITLENHFAVNPEPLNGRREMLPRYIILGWILGCIIAQLVDKRKAVYAWLKQK